MSKRHDNPFVYDDDDDDDDDFGTLGRDGLKSRACAAKACHTE